MLSSILVAASDFVSPKVDYHALAPEIVLAVGICVVLLVDLFVPEHRRWITGTVSGFFLLVAVLPLVTLAVKGADVRDADVVNAAVSGIVSHLGPIDILVYAAGVNIPKRTFAEIDPAKKHAMSHRAKAFEKLLHSGIFAESL